MQQELSTTDFGLIGHPLGHSFSKAFFTEVFSRHKLPYSYDNFDLPELTPEALYSLVLLNPRLRGFNVTAPYKEKIIAFLDGIAEQAERVGAVNTVVIRRATDGRVVGLDGYNTDVEGFRESILPLIQDVPEGCGALVLGTGGASKAAVEGLSQLNRPALRVSRSSTGEGIISYSDITPELLASHPIVVNATPAGTYPNVDTCPPFPVELLNAGCRVFDMVYNPAETLLMRRAAERGAKTKNGLEMLYRQAIASYNIWQSNQQTI